jgi:glycosyltransferase involved in cell wall biosynthesis
MYTPSADGGHALYTWELMTALAQRATAETHFELVTSEDLAPEFRTDRYPIHPILPRLSRRKEFSTSLTWATNRMLHYPRRELKFLNWLKGRPDIEGVHFQEYKPWLAAPLFKRLHRTGRKIYYTVHNIRPHQYPRGIPKPLMDHWNHQSWRMCDGLFVHTRRLADELAQTLGERHPPIHVSPHGTWTVHNPVQVPSVQERMAWRKLLFFGTIRQNKGLDLLLDAAEKLPGFSITIAGESFHDDYFNLRILPQVQKLRDMGMQVELHDGFTPEEQVGPLLARHSVIVLPYTPRFIAQSGVVFLALAHELPVVASEVGGLRDLFSEYQVGATFSDLTPQGLAAAILDFFGRVPCQRVAEEMKLAREHYSWSAAAKATMAGYGIAQQPLVGATP